MQDGTAEEPPPKGPVKRVSGGRIGYWAGVSVFWTLTLYLVVVAFYSIVPQALAPAPGAPAPPPGTCRSELLRLRDALLEGLSEHVRAAGPAERAWLDRWDRHFDSVRPGCRGKHFEEAVTLLARVRREAARHARSFDRNLAPDLHRFERLLRRTHHHAPPHLRHSQEDTP